MEGNIVASVACYLAHLFELTHGQREEGDKLLLILTDADAGNLCQALQRHIAEHRHVQELKSQNTCLVKDYFGLQLVCLENNTCWLSIAILLYGIVCVSPHLIHQRADQFGFKDVAQRNPVEKT